MRSATMTCSGIALGIACLMPLTSPVQAQVPADRGAELGFSIRCSQCVLDRRDGGSYQFSLPPEVFAVEPGGPAEAAGLHVGDTITHVDGVPVTSEEGGQRLARVRPAVEIRLRVRRGGEPVDLVIRPAPGQPRQRALQPQRYESLTILGGQERRSAAADSVRRLFTGEFAGVDVTVDGPRPVTITIVEPDCLLEVDVNGTRIRLRSSTCR